MQPASATLGTLLSIATLVVASALTTFGADAANAKPPAKPLVEGHALPHQPDASGWIKLFDGKTLSGWSTFDPGHWTVDADGNVVGQGSRSHLFSPQPYKNLEFKAEVKLNNKGNSGMYFRAKLGPGWPEGYESQVENTSSDPQRTGSLYNRAKMLDQIIADDTWWTQHIIAIGNRIIIKVNDKIVVDFTDTKNSFMEGHLALQQHNDGSIVHYRNVVVKPLPDDEAAALAIARKDVPNIGDEPLVKTRK
jgi:hypothetical protein